MTEIIWTHEVTYQGDRVRAVYIPQSSHDFWEWIVEARNENGRTSTRVRADQVSAPTPIVQPIPSEPKRIQFEDIRIGDTIRRVYTRPCGTKSSTEGIVERKDKHIASSKADGYGVVLACLGEEYDLFLLYRPEPEVGK